jgi:hypothetical protein
MERTILVLVGLAVLTLLSAGGCSSLTVVTELNNQRFTLDEQPVAHLSARVGGIYLFYYIPLVTGDSEQTDHIRFFRHEPDVERVVHMVTRKSKELGATRLTDLYSWSDSVWAMFLAHIRRSVLALRIDCSVPFSMYSKASPPGRSPQKCCFCFPHPMRCDI